MFDNLREQANSTPFYEDEAQFEEAEGRRAAPPAGRASGGDGHFLGMTPMQRFVIALMLLITVCVLGSMFLLMTGRVSLF